LKAVVASLLYVKVYGVYDCRSSEYFSVVFEVGSCITHGDLHYRAFQASVLIQFPHKYSRKQGKVSTTLGRDSANGSGRGDAIGKKVMGVAAIMWF
jgi:hypothetical protein